jgi:hydrogenase nickel insertion protein HypA
MHEYSIVQALMEQVETLAEENEAERVSKVVVKIGVMSGVEPHLLEIAFDTFKEKSICEGAEFVLNIQPLTILCLECDIQSELDEIAYCCPQCRSLKVEVVDGEDMFLMSLEMQ